MFFATFRVVTGGSKTNQAKCRFPWQYGNGRRLILFNSLIHSFSSKLSAILSVCPICMRKSLLHLKNVVRYLHVSMLTFLSAIPFNCLCAVLYTLYIGYDLVFPGFDLIFLHFENRTPRENKLCPRRAMITCLRFIE